MRAARASRLIDRVVVSTDDQRIARAATTAGAEVPWLRPAELAADDAAEWLAWQHAIRALRHDDGPEAVGLFVSIPPTSPLRSTEDIDRCIQRYHRGDCDVVITVRDAARNPFFNMVTVDESGAARLALGTDAAVHRRQDAPPVYEVATVAYVANPDFVLRAGSLFDGVVATVSVPRERALDVDDALDLAAARSLRRRGWHAER